VDQVKKLGDFVKKEDC